MEKSCDYPVTSCCWSAAWFQFFTWGDGRPESGPNNLKSRMSPPSVGGDTSPSATQFFSLMTKLCGDVKVRFWASSSFRLLDTGIRSEGCSRAPQRSEDAEMKDGVWWLWAAELPDAQISGSGWHRNRGILFWKPWLGVLTACSWPVDRKDVFSVCPTADGWLVSIFSMGWHRPNRRRVCVALIMSGKPRGVLPLRYEPQSVSPPYPHVLVSLIRHERV